MKNLLSSWYKPRRAIRYLEASPRSYFLMLAILALSYFIQIGAFTLSLPGVAFAPLKTLNGLELIGYSFLFVLVGMFTAIQAATLVVWICAKKLGGQGTLPQTRTALTWSLLWTVPLGVFLLLIYFTIRLPEQGVTAVVVRILSYAGTLAMVLYVPFVFVTTTSEAHRFSSWRALLSLVGGGVLFGAAASILFLLFRS